MRNASTIMLENSSTGECAWISETYDKYAAMLYAVLLDLCQSEEEAKKVLIMTFKGLHTDHYFVQRRFIGLLKLVQLAVDIAKNLASVKSTPCIKAFKQSPLLHRFLFENVSLDTLCLQSGLNRVEIARQVCAELGQVRAVPVSGNNIETGLPSSRGNL